MKCLSNRLVIVLLFFGGNIFAMEGKKHIPHINVYYNGMIDLNEDDEGDFEDDDFGPKRVESKKRPKPVESKKRQKRIESKEKEQSHFPTEPRSPGSWASFLKENPISPQAISFSISKREPIVIQGEMEDEMQDEMLGEMLSEILGKKQKRLVSLSPLARKESKNCSYSPLQRLCASGLIIAPVAVSSDDADDIDIDIGRLEAACED